MGLISFDANIWELNIHDHLHLQIVELQYFKLGLQKDEFVEDAISPTKYLLRAELCLRNY